jgi:hypothetical protein
MTKSKSEEPTMSDREIPSMLDADGKLVPRSVTARELHHLRFDRLVLERLKKKCAEVEAKLDDREATLIARIEAGAEVEGEAAVVIRQRTSVSWFTVCRRELGEDFMENERHAWPATVTKVLKLGDAR